MSIRIYEKTAAAKKADEGYSFEAQFSQMANAALKEKLPILQPYQVGFQTLKRNDDGTEAVGVGIYRIGDDRNGKILQVPAFYRNNELKTGLMFIIPSSNMMLPATETMIAYVRDTFMQSVGKPTDPADDPSVNSGMPGQVRIRDIRDPLTKGASSKADMESLEKMAQDLGEPFDVFDFALSMGKPTAEFLMGKLASDTTFLNQVLEFHSPDELLSFVKSARTQYPERAKKAASPRTVLVEPFSKEAANLSEQDTATLMKNGFLIKSSMEVPVRVYMNNEQAEKTIPVGPGVYQLIDTDGIASEATLLQPVQIYELFKDRNYNERCWGNPDSSKFVALYDGLPKGTCASVPSEVIARHSDKEINLEGKAPLLKDVEDSLREPFFLCMKSGTALEVNSTYVKVDEAWVSPESWSECQRIVISGSVKNFVASGTTLMVPEDTYYGTKASGFVPRNPNESYEAYEERKLKEKTKHTRDWLTLDTFARELNSVYDKNTVSVRIVSSGPNFAITSEYDGVHNPDTYTVKEAAFHLVDHFGVSPDDANTMLLTAYNSGTDYKTTEFRVEKHAAMLEQNPGYFHGSSPWDTSGLDPEEFINTPPEEQIISTIGINTPDEYADRVNMGRIMDQAAASGVSEIFDCSLMKVLMDSTEPVNLLGDWVAKGIKYLDTLSRMLFLLEAHYDTFSDIYGESKLDEFESNIRATMEKASDTILFIRNRNLLESGLGSGDANGLSTGVFSA